MYICTPNDFLTGELFVWLADDAGNNPSDFMEASSSWPRSIILLCSEIASLSMLGKTFAEFPPPPSLVHPHGLGHAQLHTSEMLLGSVQTY